METLFEFDGQIPIPDRKGLENYLSSLWRDYRYLSSAENLEGFSDNVNKRYQPFLSFDGNFAKANNYIGFIQSDEVSIEIYPKIFKNLKQPNKELMHRHLFFWFSYCRKIKFPFNQSFLDNFQIDSFPELIIYLWSKQIYETVSSAPFSDYEAMEEALLTPRGKINFGRYTRSMSYGRNNLTDCDYEPFLYDNKVNRILKYCVRILSSQTAIPETQSLLNQIIFLFDEVEDCVGSLSQLDQIRIQPLFKSYEDLMQCCRMILECQIYSNAEYEMKNWSLLFPMEYIFEDFISGFI